MNTGSASTPSIFSAIKRLRDILTPEEKVKWLCIVGFALVVSALEVITASVIVVFAQLLNEPSAGARYLAHFGFQPHMTASQILIYSALAVGGIYLIKNIIAAIEVFYQNITIQKMNYGFKGKLLHRYAGSDYGFYLTRNSSFGLQVISGDVERSYSMGMVALANILSESVVFICLIAMIIYMNPMLAGIIFSLTFCIGLFVTKFLLPRFYHWGEKLQQSTINASKHLMQFFHAFKEIILLGRRKSFINHFQHYAKEQYRIQAIQTSTNALPRLVIEILFVGLFVLTISYLCVGKETPTQMIGLLSGYLYAGFRLMPGLNRIINQLNNFKYVIPSIERIHTEYFHTQHQENYQSHPGFKFQHSIVFQQVNFRYINTPNDALNDINMTINKGDVVGIVGETGSGKSTLVDLLLGLLKPNQGNITIDNQFPVSCYEWHQKIGYVPQSVYLTDDSIAANIAFGDEQPDAIQIQSVIDAAQLRQFIDALPQGVETLVGERGVRLSGGERQRIAIARALYKNPEVLIFDEATSALDNATESKLMETIHAVSQNRTVIMIAHRLSSLKACQRIIQMNQGTIECITTFDTLMATPQIKKEELAYAKQNH